MIHQLLELARWIQWLLPRHALMRTDDQINLPQRVVLRYILDNLPVPANKPTLGNDGKGKIDDHNKDYYYSSSLVSRTST